MRHEGSRAIGGEPREAQWRKVSAKLWWLGEGNLWDGDNLEHFQIFLLSIPVANGGYFLGHLLIPASLNKNKIKTPTHTPVNPSIKEPKPCLEITASCPSSLWYSFVIFKGALKQKKYSSNSLGS